MSKLYKVSTLLQLVRVYVAIKDEYSELLIPHGNLGPFTLDKQAAAFDRGEWLSAVINQRRHDDNASMYDDEPFRGLTSGNLPITAKNFPLLNPNVNPFYFKDGREDVKPGIDFGKFFRGYLARQQPFESGLQIRIADPIFQSMPIGMLNYTGASFLSVPNALGVELPKPHTAGEVKQVLSTPTWLLLGRPFDVIMNSYNSTPVDYEAEMDKMTKEPFLLERYVRGLVAMTPNDLSVGDAVKYVVMHPDMGGKPVDASPRSMSSGDIKMLELISYAAVLIQTRRDLHLIMFALEGQSKVVNQLLANLPPLKTDLSASRFIAPLLMSREQQGTPFARDGLGWLVRLAWDINEFTSSVQVESHGVAPRPESEDETPTEDLERIKTEWSSHERTKVKWLAIDMAVSRVQQLIKAVDEKLKAKLEQGLVLKFDPNELQFVSTAEVNVWPSIINKNDENVYILNPIPPIVENVLIPFISS